MKQRITYHLTLAGITLLSGLALTSLTQAETIKIPVGQQNATQHITTPHKGMTMSSVRSQFGEPTKQDPAKGEPPITRWEYDQFVVFFEGDTVIHSVLKFQPKNQTP